MRALVRLVAALALSELGRVGAQFGKRQGDTIDIDDTPVADVPMPPCLFLQDPNPPAAANDTFPHLVDLFADQDGEFMWFVGVNQRLCYTETSFKPENPWASKKFTCHFATKSGTTATSATEKIVGGEDSLAIKCRIPDAVKEQAFNIDKTSRLTVTVVADAHPTDLFWNALPVCANPVVPTTATETAVLQPKQHFLSACLYAKGDPYWSMQSNWVTGSSEKRLWEWIEVHRMVGIEHFYVYDNSDDPFTGLWELVADYVKQGVVTYIPWANKNCVTPMQDKWTSQLAMESSCIHKFGSTNTWIAHMDVDEFLLPNATNPANLDGSGEASLVPLIMARNDSEVSAIAFPHYKMATCGGSEGALYMQSKPCVRKSNQAQVKLAIRPDRVHTLWVHYANGPGGQEVNTVRMPPVDEGGTEARMLHGKEAIDVGYDTDGNKDEWPNDPDMRDYWLPRIEKRMEEVHGKGWPKKIDALVEKEYPIWIAQIRKYMADPLGFNGRNALMRVASGPDKGKYMGHSWPQKQLTSHDDASWFGAVARENAVCLQYWYVPGNVYVARSLGEAWLEEREMTDINKQEYIGNVGFGTFFWVGSFEPEGTYKERESQFRHTKIVGLSDSFMPPFVDILPDTKPNGRINLIPLDNANKTFHIQVASTSYYWQLNTLEYLAASDFPKTFVEFKQMFKIEHEFEAHAQRQGFLSKFFGFELWKSHKKFSQECAGTGGRGGVLDFIRQEKCFVDWFQTHAATECAWPAGLKGANGAALPRTFKDFEADMQALEKDGGRMLDHYGENAWNGMKKHLDKAFAEKFNELKANGKQCGIMKLDAEHPNLGDIVSQMGPNPGQSFFTCQKAWQKAEGDKKVDWGAEKVLITTIDPKVATEWEFEDCGDLLPK